MKKFTIFTIIFVAAVISTSSVSSASNATRISGFEWQKFTTDSKAAFLLGWIKGGKESFDNFPIPLTDWNKTIEYSNAVQKDFVKKGILLGGLTLGQIIETIDRIYSDPRSKQIDIVEIMPIVNGILKLGWTSENIDKTIAIISKLYHCEQQYGSMAEECQATAKEKQKLFENLTQ